MWSAERLGRQGFAAPLAVTLLIAIALLVFLLLESALAELRAGSAAAAEARVVAAAETMLAQALTWRLDSGVLAHPAGTLLRTESGSSPDSTVARVESLATGLARISVTAQSRNSRIRVFVGIRALVRLQTAPASPAEVIMAPLPDNWWVAVPQ
jgi:hypothetical protein